MAFLGAGALKGLMVTLGYLRRKPYTVQYPEERLTPAPRFRGNTFVWFEERCTGCAACAKGCPLGIIRIVTHPEPHSQVGSDYHVDVFDIDTGRCMFCALCVEVCPYDALHMGGDFERAAYERKDLVITIDDLRTLPKKPSTQFRPQLEAIAYQGDEELDEHEVGRWSL
ncbi:MAG: NADH-quinone oxidoreductase subunit I [Chloroflexi bacterium]|nr:NADH-quinone oxidoreductase subunit I [Chloroflexota bacterium]